MITSDLLASSATTANVYQQCVAIIQQQQQQSNTTTTDAGADTSSFILMQCISDRIQGIIEVDMNNVHTNSRNFFLLYAASLVFFMQAGLAMLCAGSVRKKNIQNTMLKNLLDACGAAIAFYSIGYALAYGGSHSQWGILDNDYASNTNSTQKTFMGTSHFFLYNVTDYAFWLFQYAFSAACTTIVAGALAERCQMVAYLCYSVILSGWVYPIIVHAIWSQQGFLSAYSPEPLWHTGVIDFAGAGVVHITGGMTALFATIILGPRRGRFHNDEGVELETPREFPGSSVALQVNAWLFCLLLAWKQEFRT